MATSSPVRRFTPDELVLTGSGRFDPPVHANTGRMMTRVETTSMVQGAEPR